ncbi:DUF456 domain-containing protein [Streptomyces katsurahamanus]|uniref:DUF456 domain-containing protein n=1 Tax=Streptomyces katsurahamanus TaxID=2577098 RepID=A0ABW9NNM9_9ACTN|nr:DUF456 domain-containing protein [Streptomyces katsurahamanus]MQS34885.1 DUF456 domain-containing protein [Streptomyces katsurahamanus]
MGVEQLLLVGLVMALGVVGVLVPGVPGRWLVWAAMLWWALHELSALAWTLLVAATALLLVDQVVVWLLPSRRIRGTGISPRVAACAGLGAVAGFVVLPVAGAIPGFIGGIYATERHRLGGHGPAMASTRAVMRGAGTSLLVELFACLLVVGAWLGAVIWG